MNCREAQLAMALYVERDPDLSDRRRVAYEAHVENCPACAEEQETAQELWSCMRQLYQFPEDPEKWWQRDEHAVAMHKSSVPLGGFANKYEAWADFQRRCPEFEGVELPSSTSSTADANGELSEDRDIFRIAMRVAAVAAVVLVFLGIGLALLGRQDQQKLRLVAQSDTQIQPSSPETTITENGVTLSSSGPLTTDDTTTRELLINGRHRVVMNRDTSLSFAPLVENGKFGCIIGLRSGQIFANVDHDGNPFVVRFPHGRAVITGTTFDIKVTEHETALVVAEGSVRLASDQGSVQVNAGHGSTLRAQAEPTEPVACDVGLLMAWAGERENMASVAATAGLELDKLLEEMPLSFASPSQPIALESLDYNAWVESKREWFKVQFPWIFELQEALKEKVLLATDAQLLATTAVPDYPELLLQTGDIWQIVYPERLYRIIPVFDANSLLAVAEEYDERDVHKTKVSQLVAMASQNRLAQHETAFGMVALERWVKESRRVRTACIDDKDVKVLCESSQSIGEYLENTRALLWLSIQNDQLQIPLPHKHVVLSLLEQQVSSAYLCKGTAWRMSLTKANECSGTDEYLQGLTEAIEKIKDCELKISEHRRLSTGK